MTDNDTTDDEEPTIYEDEITPADDVHIIDGHRYVERMGEPFMRVVDRPPAPQSQSEAAEMEHAETGEPLGDIMERKREGPMPEKTPEERRRARYYRR